MGLIKQIKIGRWFKLNINSKSISLVSALKGTRINVGKKGVVGRLGIPLINKQLTRVLVSTKTLLAFIKAHKWFVIVFIACILVLCLIAFNSRDLL
jgi:hypothetical protein